MTTTPATEAVEREAFAKANGEEMLTWAARYYLMLSHARELERALRLADQRLSLSEQRFADSEELRATLAKALEGADEENKRLRVGVVAAMQSRFEESSQ